MTRAVQAQPLNWRRAVALLVTVIALVAGSVPLAALASQSQEHDRPANAAASPTAPSTTERSKAAADTEAELKDQGNPSKDSVSPAEKPLPLEVKPDVMLLRDKDGNLQSVPGFTLEDFTKLYNLKNGLADRARAPRFLIERLSISATAAKERVQLKTELNIRTHEAGWIKVPLLLSSAILEGDPTYVGDGDFELQFDADSDGYVLWLRGEGESTHGLTLSLAAPISRIGKESELKLAVPRATIASLKLDIDGRSTAVRVPDGILLDSTVSGNRTTFNVKGLAGDFRLAWREADAAAEAGSSVYDVTGMVLARFDERSVGWDARLTIRSYGVPFDRLLVRLPRRAALLPTVQTGMKITPSAAGADSRDETTVEVKLDKKVLGPVEIRLLAERQRNAAEDDQPAELSGFEVIGALRQRGHIAVQIVGNWQVMWGESQNVRQVDEVPEELKRENLAAGFEYFVQPYALSARIVPQRTRLTVDPQYVVLVGPHRTQLQAKLRYSVRGAKVRNFDIRMPGWEVDRIGPSNLLDASSVERGGRPLNGSIIAADFR